MFWYRSGREGYHSSSRASIISTPNVLIFTTGIYWSGNIVYDPGTSNSHSFRTADSSTKLNMELNMNWRIMEIQFSQWKQPIESSQGSLNEEVPGAWVTTPPFINVSVSVCFLLSGKLELSAILSFFLFLSASCPKRCLVWCSRHFPISSFSLLRC